MRLRLRAVLTGSMVLAAALCSGTQAQTVLKGKDLNETNLIDALQPAETEVDDGIKLRGLHVRREPSTRIADDANAAPARKPSASVLITFMTNSAQLAGPSTSSLDVVARALQADKLASYKFVIEGHADPRGNAEDNLRLSQARADSVVNYLAEQRHISRDRLKPIGKGDTELLNTTQIDAPENRRVTIVTATQ